jgi:hypothetical protein
MTGRTHIVGAGVAGLAAALAVARAGGRATLYEAAPHAGGRCRTIEAADGFSYDNGTHVLFAANRRTLALIDEIGARDGWIEPEPDGVPVYDAERRRLTRVALSPWAWLRSDVRPEGLSARDLLRLVRLSLPVGDRPVADIMGEGAFARTLIEPLTVAVLNTPANLASSRRLGTALRRLARPGAGRLLVASRGLGPNLIDPALRALGARGVALHPGQRLRAVEREGRRATGLVFAGRTVALTPQDRVILALPPAEVARLLPDVPVPDGFEPILNVHYRYAGPERPRFLGLLGTTAQWALLRRDHVSVTVSAAARVIDEDGRALPERIWREIAPGLAALGFPADGERPPDARVVKEKRATIRQAAGSLPPSPMNPLQNLALAGDWLQEFPASIEAAVVSGQKAARASRAGRRLSGPVAARPLAGAAGTR